MVRRSAFTLVELLVVIAIIGILVALLLPAVQAAREAGRRMQCSNHLKQLALGALNHEQAHRIFPTSGWGTFWTGDPDMGSGDSQPGSWMFSILPFIEEQAIYEMGAGQPGWPVPMTKQNALLKRNQLPVASFYCPSRRAAVAVNESYVWSDAKNWVHHGEPMAMNDYAANAGSTYPGWDIIDATYLNYKTWTPWPPDDYYNGICYIRSKVSAPKILDGLSKTYLLGEKYVPSEHYEDGVDHGDFSHCYAGSDGMTMRSTGYPLLQDQLGVSNFWGFGSSHPGGCQVAFCDGSVHIISYEIDPQLHSALGTRAGSEILDMSGF